MGGSKGSARNVSLNSVGRHWPVGEAQVEFSKRMVWLLGCKSLGEMVGRHWPAGEAQVELSTARWSGSGIPAMFWWRGDFLVVGGFSGGGRGGNDADPYVRRQDEN